MRVAQRFSGYTLEKPTICARHVARRTVSSSPRSGRSSSPVVPRRFGEALGKQLFDIIEPFADYAFNKSHSTGTAWSPTRRRG